VTVAAVPDGEAAKISPQAPGNGPKGGHAPLAVAKK